MEDFDQQDDPFLEEFFELRLVYVRLSPSACDASRLPDRLTLQCFTQDPCEFLQINGARIANEPGKPIRLFPLTLRRAEADGAEASHATYTSTDRIKMNAHGMWFEIVDGETMIAVASFAKWKCDDWTKTDVGLDTDARTGYALKVAPRGLNPKVQADGTPGVVEVSLEVYVAGCCSGVPVAVADTGSLVLNCSPS